MLRDDADSLRVVFRQFLCDLRHHLLIALKVVDHLTRDRFTVCLTVKDVLNEQAVLVCQFVFHPHPLPGHLPERGVFLTDQLFAELTRLSDGFGFACHQIAFSRADSSRA